MWYYLAHKGRLTQTLDDVLRVIGSDPRCTIYPIDLSVISKAPLGLDIHDSLIVGQIANLPYKLVPTYPLVTLHSFSSSAAHPRASSSSLARVGRPLASQPAIP